jgi:uncharacterized membrane protein
MTLILSLVGQDYAVQVADRRISLLHSSGRSTIRDDNTNKVVNFANRAVFGFTGIAELEGKRTDLWIADRLKESPDLGDGFDALRNDLTTLFARRPYKGHRHAVTAAGFKWEPDGSVTPYYALVTNMFENGRWLSTPRDRFLWLDETYEANTYSVHQAPAWLTDHEHNQLRRTLRTVQSRGLSVSAVVQVMARAIRAVRSPLVGPDLMVTILPRAVAAAREGESHFLTGGVGPNHATFAYLSSRGEVVQYGPTVVTGDGGVITDFTFAPL